MGSIVSRMACACGLYPGCTSMSIQRMISSASSSNSASRGDGTSPISQWKKAQAIHSRTFSLRRSPTWLRGQRSLHAGARINQPHASARFMVRISAWSTNCSTAARSESGTATGSKSTLAAACCASSQSRSNCSTLDSCSWVRSRSWRSCALGDGDGWCCSCHAVSSGMLRPLVICGSASLPPAWIISTVSRAFRRASIVLPGGISGALAFRLSSCQCLKR
mmetsp:Transcript_128590/g.372102  ORF Transcript_128590/g.372102 Transcript_128590/m.372102 type:complete len:221 (-) Transcript_128590:69-731(-)